MAPHPGGHDADIVLIVASVSVCEICGLIVQERAPYAAIWSFEHHTVTHTSYSVDRFVSSGTLRTHRLQERWETFTILAFSLPHVNKNLYILTQNRYAHA